MKYLAFLVLFLLFKTAFAADLEVTYVSPEGEKDHRQGYFIKLANRLNLKVMARKCHRGAPLVC
ncbi:MAG: hypothetical protein ACI8WB_000328 [Phenylobacterium sp.]|jgi:hypothetical protein